MQVEEELQSYTAEFARSTQSHRIFNDEDSIDSSKFVYNHIQYQTFFI